MNISKGAPQRAPQSLIKERSTVLFTVRLLLCVATALFTGGGKATSQGASMSSASQGSAFPKGL